ncbi:MAG TPA: MOSC domain-containing protein [Cytophagales bacterium]
MALFSAKESIIGKLINAPVRPGEVTWIGIRPARKTPVTPLPEVEAVAGRGLAGDHYKGNPASNRHVTLIQAEHLAAVAAFLGRADLDPGLVRRNLVVRGLNLLALKDRQFYVGDTLLEMTGACHPCSQMEDILGEGGYNAMRGHGGITARILRGGTIRVGDPVYAAPPGTVTAEGLPE